MRDTAGNRPQLPGQQRGTVQATICIDPTGGATLNDSYYNYVQDHQADGVAARAYIHDSWGPYGPLAVDGTSTSGGQDLGSWESTATSNTYVRVYVCLGLKRPGQSGARCASDVTYA